MQNGVWVGFFGSKGLVYYPHSNAINLFYVLKILSVFLLV